MFAAVRNGFRLHRNRSYLIVSYFRFLCLPEMEFLNIIFCSLPDFWAGSMFVRGRWFLSCSHQNRADRMAPTKLGCGFRHSLTDGAFFVGVIFSGGAFVFPRRGL